MQPESGEHVGKRLDPYPSTREQVREPFRVLGWRGCCHHNLGPRPPVVPRSGLPTLGIALVAPRGAERLGAELDEAERVAEEAERAGADPLGARHGFVEAGEP